MTRRLEACIESCTSERVLLNPVNRSGLTDASILFKSRRTAS